jgi:transcriptional regulator with XRE-family HTH domain
VQPQGIPTAEEAAMTQDRREPGPDPVDIHVGRRVRARRQSLGVSQGVLAQAIGVTFQQVQKYERGHNRISASKLYAIARMLRTPLAWFFEGLADPAGQPQAAAIDPGVARIDALLGVTGGPALAEAFVAIKPPVRAAIVTLARACAHDDDLRLEAS